jgi:prevent-host-death family protein
MPMTTMTSREFNQGARRATRAAKAGPVFITDRGEPRHVLLSIEDYRRLIGERRIADVLAMPDAADIAFNPPKATLASRPADLD